MPPKPTEYKIEKGIPLPPVGGGIQKYPWDAMEVGDSFFVAGRTPSGMSAARNAKSKNGKRFTTRSVDGGVRVWRVE